MNGLAPPYLSKIFIKRNEIHDLNTRNNKALHIPQHKTVSGQRTFYYRAVKLWNYLDEDQAGGATVCCVSVRPLSFLQVTHTVTHTLIAA